MNLDYFKIVIYVYIDLVWLHRFSCINHVYAEYYDNRNCKDWFCDRLNNQYTQNVCGFHN